MKMKMVVLVGIMFFNFLIVSHLWAEETPAAASAPAPAVDATAATAPADETEYSFGEVKSISASQLVLLEYDYLTDKESDVTYAVDPAVTFENAKSIDEIKVGDSVEIDYKLNGDSKVVKTIILEKEEDAFAGDDLGNEAAAPAPDADAKTTNPVQ